MRRQHPFASTTGWILTAVLLAGLGVGTWFGGGKAFSPGPLSAATWRGQALGGYTSHAEFEQQCRLCHQPLKVTQDVLCLDCHVEVAAQIQSGSGTHSTFETVQNCSGCHSDHQGRDFDLLAGALSFFDHSRTRFSLAQHAVDYETAPLDCQDCHTTSGSFQPEVQGCIQCHAGHDADFMRQHQAGFGERCLGCHDGVDRMLAEGGGAFDHAAFGFILEGRHQEIACAACHSNAALIQPVADLFRMPDLPTLCAGCHAEPEVHAGLFGLECQACHATTAWLPATFDHQIAGAVDCESCHAKDRPAQHYTGQCSTCHTNAAWLPASFDHQLAGATKCESCHTKDRPAQHYAGQCSACHATTGWLPASFDHQIAGAVDCEGCHTKDRPAQHYAGQCSACHATTGWLPASFDHQIAGATDCEGCHTKDRPAQHYAGQCSLCHSTTGWLPASFDHTGQTNCQGCHGAPAGHWPGQCSKCHSPSGWTKISLGWHSFPINHEGAGGVCSKCHNGNSPAYTCYKCHDQGETQKKHNEEGIFDIAGRCANCHRNGKDDD